MENQAESERSATAAPVQKAAAALDHTFNKARYIIGAYTPKYFARAERYSLLRSKVENYPRVVRDLYRRQLADQRDVFDHDHCFCIINGNRGFFEYFIFYASRENSSAIGFYLNNIDRLESFCQYFLDVSGDLVARADRHRIPAGNELVDGAQYNRGSFTLTAREKDVAKLLMIGATIKDAGVALGIAPRTVETHVENMKGKLGCSRKSALVKQLCLREPSAS